MAFIAVCRAVYDYTPQAEGELELVDGDLLFILEKGTEDDWWKAKKKAAGDEEDEPIGLVPSNYVVDAQPIHRAQALFEYARQTDEEISFSENDSLLVFDESDPDWTLVGLNDEFGFAPSNYLTNVGENAKQSESAPAHEEEEEAEEEEATPSLPTRPSAPAATTNHSTAAASLAAAMTGRPTPSYAEEEEEAPPAQPPRRVAFADEDEDVPPPSLPTRPVPGSPPPMPTRPTLSDPEPVQPTRAPVVESRDVQSNYPTSVSDSKTFHINEMVSIMGKQKKMPTTLIVDIGLGVITVTPENDRDGRQQKWAADGLSHYSIESKHVFLELVKPSKSIDFHAGSKENAHKIVSLLGEMAGMVRGAGLKEVIAATGGGAGQKRGQIAYDFSAQGEDEVSVNVGDEVIILDSSDADWWKVRRVKNGREGVVPSSYINVTSLAEDAVAPVIPSFKNPASGLSTVEQNRLEEQKLTRQAMQLPKPPELDLGSTLPDRRSSLNASTQMSNGKQGPKTKPDPYKVRTWHDRSQSFAVEAQFVGVRDGKIHLHKLNGVKIAVPVSKMSPEDLNYVETITGQSLDEDKPLADLKNKALPPINGDGLSRAAAMSQGSKPQYDWFDFFLQCGINVYHCERYAGAFSKDSLDESNLEDIDSNLLRNLGLKEGDILRVMKFLDNKFGRAHGAAARHVSFGGDTDQDVNDDTSGGLFSGPGGALKNNTRKGRPSPAVQTNDVVDGEILRSGTGPSDSFRPSRTASPPAPAPPRKNSITNGTNGFDDNAWDVKPTRSPTVSRTSQPSAPIPPPQKPAMTGALADLSTLMEPLQPVIAHTTGNKQTAAPAQIPQAPLQLQSQLTAMPTQPTGANPAFFRQVGNPALGQMNQLQPQSTGFNQQPQSNQQTGQGLDAMQQYALMQQQQRNNQAMMMPQQTAQPLMPQQTMQPMMSQQTAQPMLLQNPPRQRPQAPIQPQFTAQGNLMPPPPARPLSAPQGLPQQSPFSPPPMQPQVTGLPYAMQTRLSPTLNDMQRQQQMSPQMTGFGGQSQMMNMYTGATGQPGQMGLQPQMTGFNPGQYTVNGQMSQQQLQPQQTGMPPFYPGPSSLLPQPTGSINSVLPPALQPQQTASLQAQVTGMNAFNRPAFGQPLAAPPVPSIPSQFTQQLQPQQTSFQQPSFGMQQNQPPSIAPLVAQKTGPAPKISFGAQPEPKRLVAQTTGRRANLAAATPSNPFGF